MRQARVSEATKPFTDLPQLSAAQRIVLLRWLKSDAQERGWQVLLDAAGAEFLDAADTLLQALLTAGAIGPMAG